MSELPFIPLYVPDFDSKTDYLTLEEEGLYFRLLRLMWKTPGCSVPNDEKWIARRLRIHGDEIDVLKIIVEDFCTVKKGRLIQKRLQEEFGKAISVKEARSEASKKAHEAKALKKHKKPSSKRKPNEQQTDAFEVPSTTTSITTIEKKNIKEKFEVFYLAYGKKVDKKQARSQWESKIDSEELADKVIQAASEYAKSRPDPQYRKSPMRWLRDENWNDEIETKQGNLLERPEDGKIETGTGKGW